MYWQDEEDRNVSKDFQMWDGDKTLRRLNVHSVPLLLKDKIYIISSMWLFFLGKKGIL